MRAAGVNGGYAVGKFYGSAYALAARAPLTKGYPIPAQGAQYYLCRDGACAQPVDSIPELETLLHGWTEPKP